jgi:hypothetical protein
MKSLLITLVFVLMCVTHLSAQKKLTLSVYGGSGISMFGGGASTSSSDFHVSDAPPLPNYVDQPYGSRSMLNYLGGLQGRLELKNGWLIILNAQYEFTGGKLAIDRAVYRSGVSDTTGTYKRMFDFISINPQFGKIFYSNKIRIGGTIGFDYAAKVNENEKFDFTDDGGLEHSQTTTAGDPNESDLRLTASALLLYKRWTFDIGYKHGLHNYSKGSIEKALLRQIHLKVMFTFLQ